MGKAFPLIGYLVLLKLFMFLVSKKCLYVFALINHYIKIKHIVWLTILNVYTLIGALAFVAIEGKSSREVSD